MKLTYILWRSISTFRILFYYTPKAKEKQALFKKVVRQQMEVIKSIDHKAIEAPDN